MNTNRNAPFSLKSHQEDGFFCGYASVFQVLDHHHEIMAPQAFKASLDQWQRKGKLPKMLWQHDQKQPIGFWHEITEDEHGLFVKGQLLLDLQGGREAYALLKAGVIDSLSIGFRPIKAKRQGKGEPRLFEEVDLMEISLVTFAANAEAKITTVKEFEEGTPIAPYSPSSIQEENKPISSHNHPHQQEKIRMTTKLQDDSQDQILKATINTDSQQQEKIDTMEHMLKTSTTRLEQLELALKRPTVSKETAAHPSAASSNAFNHFIRKGLDDLSVKAMISSSDKQGGYLIPAPSTHLINQQIEMQSPLRQLARVATINTNRYDILVDKVESEAGWVGEESARPETRVTDLIKLSIPVHEIYAKPLVSQRLLDDSSINMETWLSQRIAEKMARMENHSFLFGDGDNKPKGILTYETTEPGAATWGKFESLKVNLFGKESADPLLEAFYTLKSQYLPGSCWLLSRKTAATVRKLKEKSGAYLWQNSLSADLPNTLLGHPVYLCDELDEAEGSPILFGNLKEAYQIVDRANMTLLRDPYSANPYVEFYATKRVGGAAVNFDAIKIIHLIKE